MPPYYSMCLGFCSYHTFIFFWGISMAQFLVHLIWWRIYLAIRLPFISNVTKKKEEPQLMSPRKKKTGCKNIKMEIIHLSRSAWQLEPPFDNVMHKIMYARCEGHWEMLKNICCYLSRFFFLKRWRSQIYASQAMLPCACIPPLESSSSRSPHPLLRVPHPISKSIKCVCEAEEAHQLTTAPPPFFSSSSRCHRASQPPPASPPLACRTTSSTLDPAPANRLGMRGLQWGDAGAGGGGPCQRGSDFYLYGSNKRETGGREKKPSTLLLPVHLLCLSLSPFPKQFMGSSCSSLSLPRCLSPLREEVRMHRRNLDVYGSLQQGIKWKKMLRGLKCLGSRTDFACNLKLQEEETGDSNLGLQVMMQDSKEWRREGGNN